MHDVLLQSIICLFDSVSQQGLAWSTAVVEPRPETKTVNILWSYPHRRNAARIMALPRSYDRAELQRQVDGFRHAIAVDEYALIVLGGSADQAQEIDSVQVTFVDDQAVRNHALQRIERRAPAVPPALTADVLLDAMIRKFLVYTNLSMEIGVTSFDHVLLNWRGLFEPHEQQRFGGNDPMEQRRWRNLSAFAQELGTSPTRIEDALESVQVKQARLIRLRFGIGRLGEKESIASITEILGIDGPRFPQIEQNAVNALRAILEHQTRTVFG
ncbi:MAG: hypothetical protein H0T53_00685 [Herpetosiphonaceae bacterium]|nr:hypothetical protein [Herpetosiphonaceae bacterium]